MVNSFILHPGVSNYINFSEYTAGVQPSDWTERWVTSGVDFTVETSIGDLGGKVLQGDVSVDGRHFLSYDSLDGTNDIEVLTKSKSDSQDINSTFNRIVVRGAGGDGTEDGYICQLRYDTSQLEIRKVVNGTFSYIGASAFLWSTDTYYWIRFSVIGTALKAKIWADGDSEPGTWDIDETDSDLSSGWVGVGSQTTGIVDFDWFSWDTQGGTAPG
jgi:hypothetical protein